MLAVTRIALIGFAIVSGPNRSAAQLALAAALIALLIGAAIYGLGQGVERVLDAEREEREHHGGRRDDSLAGGD
jgi:hypothetical protein